MSGPSQHYMFVHTALPSIFFGDPSWFFAVLNGPDRDRFLADVWQRVAERTPAEGHRARDGLGADTFIGEGHLFALITLPPPIESTEAHLVAAVAAFTDADAPSLDSLQWSRFFTLEHGVDFETEAPCTFLCEWTREGQHQNYGTGPEAEAGAFVRALLGLVKPEAPAS